MPTYTTRDLTEGIVQECHAQFNRLPKQGKPTKKSNGQAEWTILAGIVMTTPADKDASAWMVDCVSLATGSKCLPQGKQSPKGDLLNDYHAEVLARRGFNSQAPCGDATTASLAQVQSEESRNSFIKGQKTITKEISSKEEAVDNILSVGSKRAHDEQQEDVSVPDERQKHPRLSGPTETSAPPPLLTSTEPLLQDNSVQNFTAITTESSGCPHTLSFRRGRINYDAVGVLRTKPGRVDSEPTLSMSCSDKIARWNILGLTSALVTPFLRVPIYLNSVITKELFDAEALSRALIERVSACGCAENTKETGTLGSVLQNRISLHKIDIRETQVPFEFSKDTMTQLAEKEQWSLPPVASASSISWIACDPNSPEVLVNGCKAGANVKKALKPASRSRLCKFNMLDTAVRLWTSLQTMHPDLVTLTEGLFGDKSDGALIQNLDEVSYTDWKRLDPDYKAMRDRLLQTVFKNWVLNDRNLESFSRKSVT
ncbi:tRNA-specific adenosine deaminase 1 [Gryganskiella cystojenkinii]|nr:tRNA-specific adenosine deaminase 1 [Gryganskiella cystojenkinii]